MEGSTATGRWSYRLKLFSTVPVKCKRIYEEDTDTQNEKIMNK